MKNINEYCFNISGKVFACIALVENACTLVASGVFNSVYPAVRHVKHGFVFLISAFVLIIPVVFTMYVYQNQPDK